MKSSEERILQDFDRIFQEILPERIVLYGTGQYTELIVKHLPEFHFVGLMDEKQTGNDFYGLRVFSREEVVSSGVKNIIIISNLSSAPVIYKRIEKFVKQHGIRVFYMNGLQPHTAEDCVNGSAYRGTGQSLLMSRAMGYDVISFDLFDTLIARRCLFPDEVFHIVERKAAAAGIALAEFVRRRKQIEKDLYHSGNTYYSLEDIYEEVSRYYALSDEIRDFLLRTELQAEKDMACPREEMCGCFRQLQALGKKTVICTDMYMSSSQLREILEKCGLYKADLLVSRECGASKYIGNMFSVLLKKYPGKGILHIGDNEFGDIRQAEAAGIDALYIAGAEKMMTLCGLDYLLEKAGNQSGRFMYALFAQRCFRGHLCAAGEDGRIPINTMADCGYLFLGPLVSAFFSWFLAKVQEQKPDRLLFVSRDGYLFHQLYEEVRNQSKPDSLPPSLYFLTSRRASSVAAVRTVEDIRFLVEDVCNIGGLKLEEMLEKVFGIRALEQDRLKGLTVAGIGKEAALKHVTSVYADRILEEAEEERKQYLKYIVDECGLKRDERIGMMNFVGRGVTQRCLSSLLEQDVTGFYFALEYDAEDILKDNDRAYAWYPDKMSTHTARSNIFIKYLFGEAAFSAPHGQLQRFDKTGPVFEADQKERAEQLLECHAGIRQYWSDMMDLLPDGRELMDSVETADEILGLLGNGRFRWSDEVMGFFQLQDSYCTGGKALLQEMGEENRG